LAQQYFAYTLGGSQFYLIAYALVFLVVMILMPRGIVPTVKDRLRMRRRRRRVDGADRDSGATPVPAPAPSGPRMATPVANGDVR
jgi:branched-chain amino acid transport system permease protein